MKNDCLRKGLVVGLTVGLVGGLGGLSGGPVSGLALGLIFGLTFGLSSGLPLGLVREGISGLSSNMLDRQAIILPNQGIRRSAKNGVFVGLASWLMFGLMFGLILGLSNGLILGLFFGVPFGLDNGLSYGTAACIQHIVLRLFLWHAGYIPWNYSHFLDYAAERILLRKVGGGYIFVHRLLLDYFASLETPSPQKASTVSVSQPDEKE